MPWVSDALLTYPENHFIPPALAAKASSLRTLSSLETKWRTASQICARSASVTSGPAQVTETYVVAKTTMLAPDVRAMQLERLRLFGG